MSEPMKERPDILPRRAAPRPARDETVDPVDAPTPPRTTTQPTASPSGETKPERKAKPAATSAKKVAPTKATPEAPPAARRVGRPRKREVTYPFSTRISEQTSELLDLAVEREGITIREAVEQAVQKTWGNLA